MPLLRVSPFESILHLIARDRVLHKLPVGVYDRRDEWSWIFMHARFRYVNDAVE
jgi:hypothetical protein